MAAGYVTKVVGDGNSGTFSARFWCPDTSASPQLLFPAGVITDGSGNLVDFTAPSPVFPSGRNYETVAASQTAQAMGATGATGDVFDGLWVVPASTSPGVVTILDNATSINVFAGGATSLSNLAPFWINLNSIASVSGAWKVTTGASISVIGVGKFT